MRLLLDTHVILWALGSARTLPRPAHDLIGDHRNDIWMSAASMFEIAAKRATGRRGMPRMSVDETIELGARAGYRQLDVTFRHALAAETIAPFHGDPFDRLLLAQATVENLQLVTHDEALAAFDTRAILF